MPVPAELQDPPLLVILGPDGKRREVPVTRSPFRIGRRPDRDLILEHESISREHALVLTVGDRYYLKDDASKHGVYVNGDKIDVRALQSNDLIQLGTAPYQLVFTRRSPETDLALLLDSLAVGARASSLRRIGAVMDVARALEKQSLEEVLGTVVSAALQVTGADRGFLLLKSPAGELSMRVGRDSRGRHLSEKDLRVSRSEIEETIRRGRGLLAMTFRPEQQADEITVDDLTSPSAVCVPLLRLRLSHGPDSSDSSFGQDVLGALCLDFRLPPSLPAGEQDLLLALATEASAALENARLWSQARHDRRLRDELSIAARIQGALLRAKLPSEKWFQVAASSHPCFQVGGDYYDVMQSSPGRWSVVVADVAGKGLTAALLASLLQGAFSTASLFASTGYQAGLNEILGLLNRYIFDRSLANDFATVFYCTLQQDGLLRWANAGHCPALLLRAGGEVVSLPATGVPLGAFAASAFSEQSVLLQPDDKLIIYSDGVTEAENAMRAMFGYERLKQVVRGRQAESATQLHQSILDAVRAFTAEVPQSDDVTLVVLEYCGA
jgi:serine phosphatase RsbU (regulator of sigma subunit)